uniref:Uncharacterized protein n=1 Tax=Gasterosteus aculeatus aculeatus TaxID=481459 RepID=G3PU32_GASAC
MGCTSTKQVSAVPNGEEGQNKAHSNGDLLSDEYKMKEVEKVKYISGEEGGVDGQESTEKSALLGKGQHMDETGSNGNGKILSIHSSESQQEFFRMLDEKIEKVRKEKNNHWSHFLFNLLLNDMMEINPVTASNLWQMVTADVILEKKSLNLSRPVLSTESYRAVWIWSSSRCV